MAVPDTRDHAHNRASKSKDSSKTATTEKKVDTIIVADIQQSDDEDDDADISDSEDDSEDDSDSDDSDDSQKEDVTNATVQPHETPIQGGPAVQTNFEEYVQSASQEKKSGKRPAEDDVQPEYQQFTLKKRKTLQDISGSNSHTNALAGAFNPPDVRSASAQDKTTTVKVVSDKPRAVSLARASKSGNNWPRMQDSNEFAGAGLADQRIELNSYRRDLFNYIDMIQAGAIPVQFVRSFFGRLDTHISQMDSALQALQKLNNKQHNRLNKMHRLHKEAHEDQSKIDELISDLTWPARYEP